MTGSFKSSPLAGAATNMITVGRSKYMADYQQLLERLRSLADAIRPICEDDLTFEIAPRAPEKDVLSVEAEIDRRLPDILRDFFLNCSAKIDFDWALDEEKFARELPEDLEEVTFGAFTFELSGVEPDWVNWTGWQDSIEHPEHYVGGPSRYRFDQLYPLISIINGDVIVVVTSGDDHGRIVYLDHEGGEMNQAILADDFESFLDTWLTLCCPGPEGWLLEPFYDSDRQRLSATCDNAANWRSLIGVA